MVGSLPAAVKIILSFCGRSIQANVLRPYKVTPTVCDQLPLVLLDLSLSVGVKMKQYVFGISIQETASRFSEGTPISFAPSSSMTQVASLPAVAMTRQFASGMQVQANASKLYTGTVA